MKIVSPIHPKIKPFLLKLFIFCIVSLMLFSCLSQKDPYYPPERIPKEIIRLCKDEYNLDVKVNVVQDTLWVYIPFKRFVDENGNTDEEVVNNLNRVALNINRVIMSAKFPPEFYVIVASDIKDIGADYMLVGYILDVKKYLYNFISREEFSRRRVTRLEINPEAKDDQEGKHLQFYNISLRSFILAQIEERIVSRFREDAFASLIKIKKVEIIPEGNNIKFNLDAEALGESKHDIDLSAEALKIITSVFFAYDFKDFSSLTIIDSYSGKHNTYSRKALEDFK